MRKIEKTDNCLILDFDQFESLDLSKLFIDQATDEAPDSPELIVVTEKGQLVLHLTYHKRQ